MIEIDLSGRVALITGASRGIGRALAVAFGRAGTHLALNYVRDDAAADSLREELEAVGSEVLLLKGSVSDAEFARSMSRETLKKWGRIDCLVNNAGITRDNYFLLMNESAWDEVQDVHVKGAFHCSKSVLKKMVAKKHGSIINISSVSAITGREGQANYAAAKAALLAMTKSLAREVGRYGVRVNAIVTGVIDTDMTKSLKKKHLDLMVSRCALGRLGMPEEVANLAVFLASDLASYITGSCVTIDGGLAGG